MVRAVPMGSKQGPQRNEEEFFVKGKTETTRRGSERMLNDINEFFCYLSGLS